MGKDLERDLGLPSVIAISMGAMIGSGIFILPGIAMAEAGPAVILAFIIAAILVVPAGLSIAELGTAMPEAGGDYIYIERGIGPAAGTIAGLGTWLMLMLKGALALFGGMVYLDAVLALPSETAAALIIGTVLIGVNIFGVKQTGQLQTVLVAGMVLILVGFIVLTLPTVESGNYEPFFSEGSGGLFTATATVLVSYAGVTKIAAAAEEVENPGRNLPLGLIISLVATTIIYALLVFVLVGIVDAETLAGSNDPMVEAVDPLFGFIGVVLIVAAAMAALISTANAGILTASRYPLALSRDELLPEFFSRVDDRFRTPVIAILVTGGAMLAFILLLDIDEIAKAAGSFQIIVYILVNIALVAFRERDLDWYDPSFTSPLYPWLQIFGVFSGMFIITQMDLLPIVGGIALVIGGLLWYYVYARSGVEREGIAIDVARRRAGRQTVDKTKAVVTDAGVKEVVVAVHPDIDPDREEDLLRITSPLVQQTGRIRVVKFTEVPSQVPLGQVKGQTADDIDFERYTEEFADELDVDIVASEIVSHDTKHAIVNHAESVDADLLIAERETQGRLDTLLGSDTDWIMQHADCDTVFVQNRGLAEIEEIVIVTDRSPFNDPFKIGFANLIAAQAGASIRCLFAVSEDAPESLVETVQEYHTDLDKLCTVPIQSQVLRTDAHVESIVSEAENADLVMLSSEVHRRLPDLLFPQRADRISALLDNTVMRVHSKYAVRHTFLRPILDVVLFRSGSSAAAKTAEETERTTEAESSE